MAQRVSLDERARVEIRRHRTCRRRGRGRLHQSRVALRAEVWAAALTGGTGEGCAAAAGLGRRAGARAVDALLGAAVMAGGALLAGVVALYFFNFNLLFLSVGRGRGGVLAAAAVAAHGAYEIYWTARHGTTPGKALAGLRIADADSGGAITLRQAVERHAVLHGPIAIAYVAAASQASATGQWATLAVGGTLWVLVTASVLWNPQRCGLHDIAADTVIVRAKTESG